MSRQLKNQESNTLSLGRLIGNLKVYEEVIKKYSETSKAKENKVDLLLGSRKNLVMEDSSTPIVKMKNTPWPQITVQTDEYGYLVISFMIQHEFITLTLAQFGQILPNFLTTVKAVFTNEWDLASLEYSQETEGPYCTKLPTPDDIRRLLELEQQYNLLILCQRIECARATPTANSSIWIVIDSSLSSRHEAFPHLDNGNL
ncbi:hypothetical protein Tco_0606277 [Tanacetum coccineum]